MLRELGATIIDADEGAHAVVEPGQPALAEIRDAFGENVITSDGRLDRERMADLAFSDDEARRQLNEIVHPQVGQWIAERIAHAEAEAVDLAVLDVPLLYESGMDSGLGGVIVVWCPADQQVARAVARGLAEADVRARIKAQMPLEDKRGRASWVIDNSGTVDETRAAVERLWKELSPETD